MADGRVPWIVRVTQTNRYNWIVLLACGITVLAFGAGGLVHGSMAGLIGLVLGAFLMGPCALYVYRATRPPTPDEVSEEDA